MTDTAPNSPQPARDRPDVPPERHDDAPETDNREQDDEHTQAHTFVNDAMNRATSVFGSTDDSDKAPAGPLDDEADVQDTVDHMEQMVSSGRIDHDAFRGERSDDDEPDMYGEAAVEPEDRR